MSPLVTHNFRVSRRVVVTLGADVEITPVNNGGFFECELTPKRASRDRDGSPQSGGAYTMRYWKSPLTFYEDPLRSGDRFNTMDGVEWEVLSLAEDQLTGTQSGLQVTEVLPVLVLYPVTGDLQELGGASVTSGVRFALWQPSEGHRDTGTYTTFSAQAPIEHWEDLQPNRQLLVGTLVYKIVATEMNWVEARVDMTLRKAGLAA